MEVDGVDGLAAITADVHTLAPRPAVYPAGSIDCIGEEAEDEFASGNPADVFVWLVRTPDTTRVESVSDRYLNKLDSMHRWGPDDWANARNEWLVDRTSQTAANATALSAAVAALPDCSVVETKTVLPYALLECSVASAEALWLALCIPDGDVVPVPLVDLEGYTGPVTTVVWFHDERYSESGTMDEILVSLAAKDPGGGWAAAVAEDESRQEKLRVRASITPGDWDLLVEGAHVTGTNSSCSSGRRVYFAYAWQ